VLFFPASYDKVYIKRLACLDVLMAKGKLKVVPGDLLIDAYGFPIFVLAVTEENKTTLFLSSTGLIS
jgi:hypothetical protein